MPERRTRGARQQRKPKHRTPDAISDDDIELLRVYVAAQRTRAPFVELAVRRRDALQRVLVELAARSLIENEELGSEPLAQMIEKLSFRELVSEPEIMSVWAMYAQASGEAAATCKDQLLRVAVDLGHSPLNAVRADRGDPMLRKEDVEDDADYQRAKRYATKEKDAARKLARRAELVARGNYTWAAPWIVAAESAVRAELANDELLTRVWRERHVSWTKRDAGDVSVRPVVSNVPRH